MKSDDVRRRRNDLGLRLGPDLTKQPSPTTRSRKSASISASPCARRLGTEVERLGAKRVFRRDLEDAAPPNRRDLVARDDAWARNASAIFDGIAEHSKLDGVLAAVDSRARRESRPPRRRRRRLDHRRLEDRATGARRKRRDRWTDSWRSRDKHHTKPTPIRQIAIPTTLSGAEVTPAGGGTDAERGIKLGFMNPYLVPRVDHLRPRARRADARMAVAVKRHPRRRPLLRGLSREERHTGLRSGPAARPTRCSRRRCAARKTVPGDPFARIESQMASYLACTNSSRAGSRRQPRHRLHPRAAATASITATRAA